MSRAGSEVKGIFVRALGLPPGAERSRYLAAACGPDPKLRRRVDALLRACGEGEGPPDPAPAPPGMTLDAPPADPPADREPSTAIVAGPAGRAIAEGPGSRVGPYKLLQQIGEGGMGIVFLAEQDRPIRRQVALKVIKAGMQTREVTARFEAERQALAMMDHPNIARVLDAGTTATGLPFFVMELVRGIPITEYCDQHHLTPRERLELFLPVCRAIQHAHQKGIIHRDVKPSNVLVTLKDGAPEPKVIDFGVAKAIEQRLTDRTMFTQFGAIVGTLEYMSPEQAEMGALDVDTRSDIYSLGVLLYELLTGSTPLERAKVRHAPYSEILRRIREEDPHKPSIRLGGSGHDTQGGSARRQGDPARLSRLVRGELDWIVMKALEKDRTRRYETAGGLARDIRRHLDGDTVEAGPPTARYRIGKFARRHRAGLATATAIALLLVATTAVSVRMTYRAHAEKRHALQAERQAEQRLDRALAAEAEARRERGRANEREATAFEAMQRFGEAVRTDAELKNNPALVRLRRSLLDKPLAFYDAFRRQVQAEKHPSTDALGRLVESCYELGLITREVGDKAGAIRAYRQASEAAEILLARGEATAEVKFAAGHSLLRMGSMLREQGDREGALRAIRRSIEIRTELCREHPTDSEYASDLSWSRGNMAGLMADAGNHDDAIREYLAVLEIRKELAATEPDRIMLRSDYAWAYSELGLAYRGGGQLSKAATSIASAIALLERCVIDGQVDTRPAERLAQSHLHLGLVLEEQARFAEAVAEFDRGGKIFDELLAKNASNTKLREFQARTSEYLARAYGRQHRPADSLRAADRAIALFEGMARDEIMVAACRDSQARCDATAGVALAELDRPVEAKDRFLRAIATFERLGGSNPQLKERCDGWAAEVWTQVASFEFDRLAGVARGPRPSPAPTLAALDRARQLYAGIGNLPHFQIEARVAAGRCDAFEGLVLIASDRPAEGLTFLRRALPQLEQVDRERAGAPRFAADLAMDQVGVGTALEHLGDLPGATAALRQAAATFRRAIVIASPDTEVVEEAIRCHFALGEVELRQGSGTEALASFEQLAAFLELLARSRPGRLKHPEELAEIAHQLRVISRSLPGPAARSLVDRLDRAGVELATLGPAHGDRAARLAEVRAGRGPRDGAERLELAGLARRGEDYGLASRLYGAAIAADPGLATDGVVDIGLQAAASAALAALGPGRDGAPPDDAARARSRAAAGAVLRAAVATWGASLAAESPPGRRRIARRLRRWQWDHALASIRAGEGLDLLPLAERAEFARLWADVAALLERAEAPGLASPAPGTPPAPIGGRPAGPTGGGLTGGAWAGMMTLWFQARPDGTAARR